MMLPQKIALFVSEDENFISELNECIRDSYMGIIPAKTIQEMQQKADKQDFDLMILDLDNPKVDIHKFMEVHRHNEDARGVPNCPVLIVSSETENFFKRFYHFDKCSLMLKPFDKDNFRDQVQKLLTKQAKDSRKGQSLAEGETLLSEGATSNELYLVASGKFKIVKTNHKGEEVIVGHAGPSEIIGEMSFLENLPRSASVIAMEPCVVHVIPSQKFYATMESQPKWLKGLLKVLSMRIRSANEVMAEHLPEGVYTDIV